MARRNIAAEIREQLRDDETYIGHFLAQSWPSARWYELFGGLASVGMKSYLITLTDKRIYLTELTLTGQPATNAFEYGEVRRTEVKGGLLGKKFDLIAGNKTLRFRGVSFSQKKKEGILNPELLSVLERQITSS